MNRGISQPSAPSATARPQSFWGSLNLRTKLVIVFLTVTIIPLVIVSIVTYYSSRVALTNDANQKLQSGSTQVANELDKFIGFNLEYVRSVSQYPAVLDYFAVPVSQRAGSPEESRVTQLVSAALSQDPVFISSVALFDDKGLTLVDTQVSDIGVSKASRTYFSETVRLGLPYVSDVEYSSTTGVPSLYFAAPVRDGAGKVLGVIRIRYAASVLQKIITESTGLAGETSYAVLLDSNNVRLAHGTDRNRVFRSIIPLPGATLSDLQAKGLMPPGSVEELSTNLADFEAGMKNIANTPFFAADTTGDGLLEQVAVHSLTFKPWSVAFIQSQSIFLQPINTQTTNNIITALFVAVAVGALGFVFSQTLSGPVVRLTQAAEAISRGNIDVQARVETGDEIGTLAETFNRMTAQLREFIATLEQRVAERTRALATTGEVSRRLSMITNEAQLVKEVVTQLQQAFNYYHAHIYLLDDAGETLLMAGGTGEAGEILLKQGHSIPVGRGLVGRAADSKDVVLVPDTSQAIGWLPNPLLPETRAEIAVPILAGERLLGVLDVQNNTLNSLSQQDSDLIGSIASQVSIALQNIRQFGASQKIANDLNVVANLGIATATITDTKELLQEVVDLSRTSFHLYHAHIYLLNPAGDTLVLAAGAGEVGRQMVSEGRSIPLDQEQSLVARAARTQAGVVVNDVRADPDFLPNPLLPDTRAEMAVPMIVGGKVLGVLDVQSETVGRFTEIDVNVKTTLAAQVGVALQNANSFARAQQQAERETLLNQIGQKIQGAATIEAAMQIAARELGNALGKKSTLLSLDPSALTGERKASQS